MRGENWPIASWTATRVTVRTRVVSDTMAVAKEDRIVCASDGVPVRLLRNEPVARQPVHRERSDGEEGARDQAAERQQPQAGADEALEPQRAHAVGYVPLTAPPTPGSSGGMAWAEVHETRPPAVSMDDWCPIMVSPPRGRMRPCGRARRRPLGAPGSSHETDAEGQLIGRTPYSQPGRRRGLGHIEAFALARTAASVLERAPSLQRMCSRCAATVRWATTSARAIC